MTPKKAKKAWGEDAGMGSVWLQLYILAQETYFVSKNSQALFKVIFWSQTKGGVPEDTRGMLCDGIGVAAILPKITLMLSSRNYRKIIKIIS